MNTTHTAKQPAQRPPIPRERFVHQIQRSAFLDWLIILGVSLTIVLALVGAGISVYLGTGTELAKPAASSARMTASLLSTQSLEKALQEFDARADRRAEIMRGFSAAHDPSLP